ncbi:hypothetical protein EDD22DRAFT_852977 [Suillus occidentalis]|nr:hypothetical protein EDD22DRAFT_852977 [Suillus occidentalis]
MYVSLSLASFTVHSTLALQFPATLPLPSIRIHGASAPSASLPSRSAFVNPTRSSSAKGKQKAREPKRKPVQVVDVPLGQATYADAVGVDDGYRPYVFFFCLSWFQKKKKKPEPQPVIYDDEFDGDDDEEENVPVAVPPPRVQHEEIELKIMPSQPQPEAGPSRLAVTNIVEGQSSTSARFRKETNRHEKPRTTSRQTVKAGAVPLVQPETPIGDIYAECSASARGVVKIISAWLCTP